MEPRAVIRKQLIKLRAQRWRREALLAFLLTIAAVVFIATAMLGKHPMTEEKPTVGTATAPPG